MSKHRDYGALSKKTTSLLLYVLGIGLLMSQFAYCKCESQCVGSWG